MLITEGGRLDAADGDAVVGAIDGGAEIRNNLFIINNSKLN
jgi:hypothetical protein